MGSALDHLDEALARLDEDDGLERVAPLLLHARACVAVVSEMTCSPLFTAEQSLAALVAAVEHQDSAQAEAARARGFDAFAAVAEDTSLSEQARNEALSLTARLRAASAGPDDALLAVERVGFATHALCVGVAAERVLGVVRPGMEHPLAHALGQLYEVEATADHGDDVHTNAGLARAAQNLLDAAASQAPRRRTEQLRALARECGRLREFHASAAKTKDIRELRTATEGLLFDVGD